MTNKLNVTIYLRETDLALLAARAAQLEKAEGIACKLGIETSYEIEDYEGMLVLHVGTDRIEELVRALKEADIRFGTLEIYDKAAFAVAENIDIEHEDLTDFASK